MTQDMKTGRYMRFIVTLLMLLVCGAGEVWSNDIVVIIDNGITHGTVTSSVNQPTREVTLTVTPASGYKTKKDLILVEKMVSPDKSSAPRRAPGLGTFDLTGTDEWVTGATTYTFNIPADYDGAYVTVTFVSTVGNLITSLSDINDLTATGNYELAADIDASGFDGLGEFKGTLDGKNFTIHHLDHPLFSSTDGATIRNINFENVNISTGDANGDAGAITSRAKGATRIYNCGILPTTTEYDADGNVAGFYGSSISGTGNVGGLVGTLSDNARVINCFSYATIANGNYVGGIVGYNSVASSQSNVATMVMNCMFYGDITGGNTISPVYGGKIIDNRDGGLATYNYYAYSQLKTKAISTGKYNCALAMEERFLNRCEIYRQLLNSNKKLAAIYATGSAANSEQMAKWILETADRQIANPMPYPVLRKREQNKKYPSIINYDAKHAPDSASVGRLNGGKLGKTLSVTISNTKTDGGQSWPTGAEITATTPLTLQRTDKDTTRCNFNYDKVQLPYYNDVGTGNYTGYRVVTGWKIVSVSGGTVGDFHAGDEFGGYNFADRKCTNKDVYSVSGRVFSQGAYYDVPYGVTAITIEPYWGQAAYVSDKYYDVVYSPVDKDHNYSSQNVEGHGTQYSFAKVNNVDQATVDINGDQQVVYTSIETARSKLNISTSGTVYDYAVVLVGNVHQAGPLYGNGNNQTNTPYTIMSVDLDKDNEPDYSFIFSHHNRQAVTPIRFDFLNVPGTAQAQKPNGATQLLNVSIFNPRGWFEVTNTSSIYITQFEADNGNMSYSKKTAAPVIFLGGVIDQYTSTKDAEIEKSDYNNRTQYIHLGSNACFKDFGNGTHSDGWYATRHVPVSVTGGDFDGFYLSGVYRPDAQIMDDDAEGYISGGRFKEVAGAAQQMINGNVRFQIYNADITNFYGGGVNAEKPITGNVTVDIFNSHVDTYCGGPKFGDMQKGGTTFTTKYSNNKAGTSTGTKEITIAEDGIVTTNATGCTFGKFFGAGYGGASSYKLKYYDNTDKDFTTTTGFNSLISNYNSDRGKYYDGQNNQYKTNYGNKGPGVATDFDYEFFVWSSGIVGARFYVYYTTFSMAKTNNVYSYLTKCTVNENFYGGGSLGVVNGTATSELTDCNVKGSVYGGGYSASIPSVPVRATGFAQIPIFNANSGIFEIGKKNGTDNFKWKNATLPGGGANALVNGEIPTDVNLDNLGAVTGNVSLTIDGKTVADENGVMMKVSGSVYGGGEESNVEGNTQVNITGGTITENVFGGGKGEADEFSCSKAMIGVNNAGAGADLTTDENKNKGTTVTISNGQVNGNVYGGGEVGRVEWNTQVKIGVGTGNGPFAPVINGSVFGAGKGKETHGYAALVRGNSTVTVQGNAKVLQNVYGGGELATVGRYWVKGVNDNVTGAPTAPTATPDEMPYQTMSGGKCTVVVQGSAQVGPDSNVPITAGHVFGAGKGVTPNYVYTGEKANWSKRMVDYNSTKHPSEGKGTTWDYYEAYTEAQIANTNFPKYVWEYFVDDADQSAANYKSGEDKYFEFLQTLALVTGTDVTIGGTAQVKGSVFGGSESGYVQDDTDVKVNGGTIGTTDNGGAYYGNVYGGGKGDAEHTGTNQNYVAAGLVKGNTKVTISNGTILHNVYGGGAYGSVGQFTYDATGMPTGRVENTTGGKAEVIITGGTFGTTGSSNGMIFGSSRGDVGAPGAIHDKLAWVYETDVKIGTENATTGPAIKGSVYGGGENGHVFRNADVNIYSGTVGIPTGEEIDNQSGASYPYRGNVYGAGCGTDKYYTNPTNVQDPTDGNGDEYNPLAGIVQGNATVTISGGHVVRNVYGAGAMGSVGGNTAVTDAGKTTINISGGRIGYDGNSNNDGNIFGAARGDLTATGDNLAQVRETEVNIRYATTPTADNEAKNVQLIAGSVFGGGEAGTVKGSVAVNMTGGLILKDVYGGGALADTQTDNWNGTTWADGKSSSSSTTTVSLTGGRIVEEAYGGGLGEAGKPAYVYGDVTVKLNEGVTSTRGCAVGQVFGANNVNGTPKGNVTVHVYATQSNHTTKATSVAQKFVSDKVVNEALEDGNATVDDLKAILADKIIVGTTLSIEGIATYQAVYDNASATAAAVKEAINNITTAITSAANTDAKKATVNALRYDVKAVYGGGNQAAYDPASPYTATNTTGTKSQVIIEGCSTTSIETVYGGGNAAAVPETNVEIREAYEIGSVFGGGNGKDDIAPGIANPGADVGTKDHGASTANNYGTGNANTVLKGGLIHEVYGGSNQKGIIKGSINQTTNPDGSTCELEMDKVVGAGKYADIDGDVNMTLSCQPSSKVPLLFAGADEANVNGNITLNITNGNFGKVFGGNNLGGVIKGKITVNVEETGCQPIKIDDLYLGGNEAAYSVFGYYESNETHDVTGKKILKPRTSATDSRLPVKPDGTEYASIDAFTNYAQPELNIISCTYIGNVFGGGFGEGAIMYANPTVNVNMVKGAFGDDEDKGVPKVMTELGLDVTKTAPNPDKLGIIRNVFGGGDAANIAGDTYVNIATEEGKSAYIIGSVFGGGNAADVLGNTNVTMSGGYVFNGVFGGGYAGNVGTFTRSTDAQYTSVFDHTAHDGCIGKPISCAENTGKCTVLVNGGQIGPISVATEGMNRKDEDGKGIPVPEGWVWGAGQGLIQDPAEYPDTHFTSYVGETDVTIGGTAFVLESIIGGGEFGRVLGDTKVTIQDHCQIGVGEGKVDANNKPIRYTDGYDYGAGATTNQFIDPTTTAVTESYALAECSHFPYGKTIGGKKQYLPYDPYYDDNKTYADAHDLGPASTSDPSDGKTWIGCVFAGGSGYMPYLKKDNNGNPVGYDWCSSAGLVEGDTEVRISGGHILTNVYGGNEYTNVKGKCKVTMTGGTIGVPRTVQQIIDHPLTCYLFGAGKGDPRPHFNTETNVGEVEIDISGGIIYGSVFGGGEDGHVQRDVKLTIGKDDHTGPVIGTWGTTYVDGNIFGGGRGFAGDAYTAGNVAGSVDLKIKGGTMLGSIYGGGRLGSVGYGLYPPSAGDTYYGAMRPDNTGDDANNTAIANFKRGYVDVEISGGTIGNSYEYIIPSAANTPTGLSFDGIATWTDANWTTWKTHNNIPLTEFDKATYILTHTKGGNVFAGGMGRMYQLDGTTAISAVDWWKMGCVKSTKLTISGDAVIKSCVYGGGELGQVVGYHSAKNAANADVNVGTEVIINGGTIGTEIKDANKTVMYTFGSVFGGGYGSLVEKVGDSYPKYIAGRVKAGTKVSMTTGTVRASIYGGGEMAAVGESIILGETLTSGFTGDTHVIVSGGIIGKDKDNVTYFGGVKMGNVYGGGSGAGSTVRSGHVYGNTNVTINAGSNGEPKIYHNVYGGGAYGTVGDFQYSTTTEDPNYPGVPKVIGVNDIPTEHTNSGVARVTINGGTIGVDGHENGMVFGSSRGDINVPGARDDYGAWVNKTYVTIGTSNAGPDIKGSVYGSGENGHVFTDTEVAIHGGTIGVHDGTAADVTRGNVYGGGCGEDQYDSNNDGVDDAYNPLSGIVYGNTKVTMDGGTVLHNIYGAGALGSVGKYDANNGVITSGGKTTIEINGGRVGYDGNDNGNVYGAARGDANATQTGISQVKETDVKIQYANTPTGDNEGKTEKLVAGSVFGGGQSGIVQGSVAVKMTGGLVLHDVYGGGALANTNTETSSTVPYTTAVNLYGGLVKGDAYGGGLGQLAVAAVNYTQAEADAYNTANNLSSEDAGYVTTSTVKTSAVPAVPALVYGNVAVNLGKADRTDATAFDVNKYTGGTHDGIVKSGRVFGCNNLNGSPQGTVTVTVNKTVKGNTDKTASGDIKSEDATKHSYHVAAVYGGGNLAGKTVGGSTNVIINGCDVSIRDVYGGGNAAAVPATDVLVNGSYEIEHVFGGGNGKDDYTLDGGTTWTTNPGANVNGNTNTLLLGGLIHEAYGGSNEKGTITGSVSINTASGQPADCSVCPLDVEKIVGAGKNADVEGNLIMILGCKPTTKTPLVFGGADNANVNGNVELTITSGTFGKVFGGNNLGGVIKGHIILNIEETGCNPINIDELYLGGNQAAYSAFGYNEDGSCKTSGNKAYDDPVLNVVSCTSIGKVFGGGWGAGAFMHANPTVNINMVPGAFASQLGGAHALGAIGDVYGGGNAADVYGDATVNIGTATKVRYHQSVTNGVYTMSDEMNVEGANITGDVFGGGYSADVKGNTQVNICAVKSGDTYTDVTIAGTDYHGVKILGSVYGGGDLGSVGTFTYTDATHNGKNPGSVLAAGKPTGFTANTGKCLVAIMGNAEIGPDNMKMYHSEITDGTDKPDDKGHVFGAGKGKLEAPSATSNVEYISYVDNTVVTISGNAFVKGSVYGGSENGHVLHDTYVNIQGGQIGCGKNTTARHPDEVWGDTYTATANTELWCPSWEYESPYAPYDPNANATGDLDKYSNGVSTEGGRRIASDGHSYFGNVFGGGSGSVPYFDTTAGISKYLSSAGTVEGNTHVTISGGHILTSVYGGCETTNVKGTANVTMTGGTIGVPRTDTQIQNHPVIGYLFGAGKGDQRIFFNKETNVNDAVVKVEGGRIYGSVYGGGEDGHVFRNVELTIGKADHTGPTIGTKGTSYYDGHVFGGGRGFGGEALTAGNVGGAVDVKIDGGSVLGSVYGGGRLASVGYGLYLTTENGYGVMREDNQYDGSYTNPSTLEASEYYTKGRGYITVDINGGTIGNDNANDNYGGNVYGGSMGRHTKLDGTEFPESHWSLLATAKQTIVNITGGTINRSVYGGGEAGPVRNNVTVNVDGGSITQDVYGGGALANTNVANWDATANSGAGGWADATKTSSAYITAVNLHGGTIGRNVYGGGLGRMDVGTPSTEGYVPGVKAKVYGNTTVELNGKVVVVDAVNTYPDDCVVKGNIFGCNNLNGSPQGTTTVHIYKTQDWEGHAKTAAESLNDPDDSHHTYNVAAVYGGGNLAAYEPVDLGNATTNVIVDGCGLTSIRQVYAGGNAASVPASRVTVNGTYEIEEVFGGGNGKDKITINNVERDNPGANVGFYDYSAVETTYPTKQARQEADFVNTYTYGTGRAAVNIFGGTIHRVFGGSNTKGNVRQSAITLLEEAGGCAFCVDEAYGGGKSAPMDAEAKLLMACIPGLREVYGGAEAADVYDDVSVTITNGTFDRVFGGNNLSGTIRGKITVNVEETGCRPVIIGELYGGGNLAAYSKYGYNDDGTPKESGDNPFDDPVVNVRSFTSIGAVYGGGYGTGAKMIASPTVNINESLGTPDTYPTTGDYDANGFKGKTIKFDEGKSTEHTVTLPAHTKGKMGAIGDVFGGGNAAEVKGNTNVNIGTSEYEEIVSVATGADVTGYYTRSGEGTEASPYTYTEATGTAVEGTTYYQKVKGADIRGNVYGGGNNAEVTGNTNVNIGKKEGN